ncbi:hypothetical protein K503DRAFT_584949 [Rhizopogon vinicolor AM-OR11-026]|uniref:Uncharacterized protein n=1 Tax=Rhizopogon vinicolor AM-OR11-026 TaxID=1314800 RepID=A0A1B7N768_9AGAM|nr:hypothetical protein K503DRAFT_584949 [Rhizopogon vinicolor AM-OR11-026]
MYLHACLQQTLTMWNDGHDKLKGVAQNLTLEGSKPVCAVWSKHGYKYLLYSSLMVDALMVGVLGTSVSTCLSRLGFESFKEGHIQ